MTTKLSAPATKNGNAKALAWDEALDYYSRHADYDEDDNGTMEVPPDLTVYLDDYIE